MSEDKKDVVNDWIKFKLMEAVKKDPLYKDPKEDKAVMKDEETNVHDGISDLLLRVLSKDDIAKLNYINGFNPERDIHAEVIPNNKKEKFKESIELKEDDAENNAESEPVQDASENEQSNPEDNENLDSTLDVNEIEAASDEGNSEDEDLDDNVEEEKNKGVGAFDRIINECEKDEILSKAIAALNSPDIAEARKEFYEWFDSFDDEHAGASVPTEDEEEDTSVEEPVASNEENQEALESEEKPAEEENTTEEDKSEVDLDSLFA